MARFLLRPLRRRVRRLLTPCSPSVMGLSDWRRAGLEDERGLILPPSGRSENSNACLLVVRIVLIPCTLPSFSLGIPLTLHRLSHLPILPHPVYHSVPSFLQVTVISPSVTICTPRQLTYLTAPLVIPFFVLNAPSFSPVFLWLLSRLPLAS